MCFISARLTDRNEIYAGSLSSESDSDDDVLDIRLFSRAQNRQVRRRISTAVVGHQSNSNTAQAPVPAALPAAAAAVGLASQSSSIGGSTNPAPAQRNTARNTIGGFLNRAGTAIRTSEHATALIGMIQLGAGHPDGLARSLGFNNRTAWMIQNIDVFFRADGPLGSFHPVSVSVLMRHFSRAQNLARTFFDRDHSNEQSGASHEEIPEWVQQFFRVFEAQQNQLTRSAQDAAVREERRSVVASLVGRQAPLGFHRSNVGPIQLRTETSRNNDIPVLRRQVVGNVDAETIYENGGDDANVADDGEFLEGRDDVGYRHSAPRRRIRNGIRRRNVHIEGFGPEDNDPSSRFYNVQRGYASLESLSQAITLSLSAPQQSNPRRMMDIVREYSETNQLMANAATDRERAFYSTALQLLHTEIQTMASEEIRENGNGNNNTN